MKKIDQSVFNTILTRMLDRKYIENITEDYRPDSWIVKLHYRIFSTAATSVQPLAVIIGDDCAIHIGNTPMKVRRTPLHAGNGLFVQRGVRFAPNATFGDGCLFEGDNVFSKNTKFGNGCMFGPGCKVSPESSFGDDCVCIDNSKKTITEIIESADVEQLRIFAKAVSDVVCPSGVLELTDEEADVDSSDQVADIHSALAELVGEQV